MDENIFWSSSLGQWISECVCSTSSSSKQNPPPLGPLIAETSWRSASNLELQPRYSELCDGVALNLIFSHLSNNNNDQSPAKRLFLFQPPSSGSDGLNVERSESLSSGVSSVAATVLGHGLAARLRQFQHLIEGLCRFYRSKSLLVLSVPDVLCIARSPLPEVSGHEMHKLLALLLGAAVQSPQREHFIDRIKRMRPEVQSELAEEIQRVTNGTANAPVINLDSLMAELESARAEGTGEAAEGQQQRIVALIERVVREREEFTSGLLEMAQEMEQDDTGPSSGLTTASSSCNGDALPTKSSNAGGRSPSPSAMDRHMSVELAAAKAEMRKLRNENEEKEEMLLELQDELEKQRAEIGRLQAERLELVKDARAAKDYKDEMDCMHHKLTRLERLEAENEKLRGRIGEMDFYKNRVNHLKEDNKIMQETYRVMEEQLEQYQRKLSAQLEVESKLIEAQASTKSLQLDMTKTRERVEELLLENGRLERDLRLSRQKCAELEREMHSITEFASPRLELSNGGGLNESSLLAQLEAHSQSQILELQLENRKLKAQLESKECTNPAELFELRAELASAEKRAQDKVEECAILGTEWERTKKVAEENAERAQKLQSISEQMERQLAELRRASVPLKTHQKAVERLEQMEQKSQQLELHSRVEKEQLELIRAEKQEVEAQLSRMCGQQKEIRAEMDSLREQIKSEQAVWERQKKALEAERAMLKGRLDAAEARAQLKTNTQRNGEYMEQRVVELERQLAEGDSRAERLEAELGQARQQSDAEMRKGQRCREELAMERDRLRDLLARLRSVCLMAIRSGSDESEKCCLEPSSLDDDLQLIAIIDDLLLKALSSARREADALRIQQQKQIRELDDLKRDIQNLRRTGHELNASDDKLLLENRNIKEQVNLLQERLHRAQSEESARAAELQAAKREIEELQQKAFSHSRQNAELASLQLCLRSQRKQEVQLRQELGSSNAQLEAALKSHAETQKRLDSLELIHSALASDHDRLQNLHQILSSDYDRVKREKETFRQRLKGEKSTAEQLLRADFVRERDQLEQQLEAERMERHRESRRMAELQAELAKKNRELAELKKEQTTAMSRSDDCSDELRRLRMAECAHKATINNLNVIVQQLNNALTEKDLELANLRRQVEMFRQYSGDENKTLIRQIELLLIQNQQLHNRSDVFYAEQRELQEKLLTLRRHKEKLEEKIMEQYKTMDSRKLERPTFMKRAAKALIAKSPSRKSRPGKDANSVSDKSEESSIYSTENEMNGSNHPSTPVLSSPPPCPVPTRSAENDCIIGGGVSTAQNRPPGPGKVPSAASKPSTTAETQKKQPPAAEAPEHLSLSRNGSAAGGSMYSSISHYQQNSIDSSSSAAAAAAILSPLTRTRNSRIGGSLRCAPMLARSFPSPAWQNASRDLLLMKEERSAAALPACCKVMQADTLPEMVNDGISSSTGRRPPLPAQPRILRELPPKVPVQHRPPPPPYPGANGLSVGKTGFSRASYRQGQPSSPTIFECPDPPSPQLVGGLPPRDMSTPKSLTAGSSVKFLSAAPSPIGFSRANSLACPKPGSSQATEALLIQPETAVERPERSPSVYENVADKGAGEDSNNNNQQQNHKNNASSSIGERRGEKGEIWYELGCV